MSYKSILLNIGIDDPVEPITRFGVDLAKRLDARLIGFCSADAPLPATMAPEGAAIAAEVWELSRDEIRHRIKDLHGKFEKLIQGAVNSEWRDAIENPDHALARSSRAADLVVTSASRGVSTGDSYRSADPGSLVLRTGRPVLIAADGATDMQIGKAVVAWKDSREARRAVADAVPLLRLAKEVTVVAIDAEPDEWTKAGIDDVVSFLAAHRIYARTETLVSNDEGNRLIDFLASINADLIVSGAYGHSRLREWVFGGVTRSLLDQVWLNRLMSS